MVSDINHWQQQPKSHVHAGLTAFLSGVFQALLVPNFQLMTACLDLGGIFIFSNKKTKPNMIQFNNELI